MKCSMLCMVLLAASLPFTPSVAAANGQTCVTSGDANLNGKFDIDDLLLLMDWLDGAPPPMPAPGSPAFLAADVNADSLIDWNDFFLFLDKLNGVIPSFPHETKCTFTFAGYGWLTYDVSTYTNPSTFTLKTPDDVVHSETEVAIKSDDEYIFRGIKTTTGIAETRVVYTLELWQTGVFHWQSFPFSTVFPFASLGYFNWDRQWYFDTALADGTSSRTTFDLTPGGAQLDTHYFARFAYDPNTHTLVFSFKQGAGGYQEVYRGSAYWGRVGMEAHGEMLDWGQKVTKIFLLSSDGHGMAHYRLTLDCQGAACPPPGGDQTPPVVTPSVTGTAGAAGWYISSLMLSWNVSDPETGIAGSSGCGTVNLMTNTTGVTYTCSATNGAGLSTTVPVTLKMDKDPPLVTPTVTGTLGPNGWYVSNVAVTWSVSDPTSGIATTSGCGPVTLTANTSGTTLTCKATNGAGIETSSSVSVKIDKGPAAVTNALISYVNALAYLDAGSKNSLLSKLGSALDSLARGNGNAAKNQLSAFINEVQAQRGKKLTLADADLLIQLALSAQAGIP